jgi:hypothetical protein
MTLQVGMICNGGIVIVGDTWQYIDAKPPNLRSGYHASKMRWSPSGQIAVACAHNMDIATAIAEEIFLQFDRDTSHIPVRQGLLDIGRTAAKGQDAECLILFSRPRPAMYVLLRSKAEEIRCEEILSAWATGDSSNPAYFWAMRYYDRRMSITELVRLGAMINVSASKFNSGIIDGIEIVILDENGLRKLEDQATEEVRKEAAELTTKVGELLFKGDNNGI